MAIKIEDLDKAIQEALDNYSVDLNESVKKQTTSSAKELVKMTKANAPVGNRDHHYKDDITAKTLTATPTNFTKLWYVKAPNYRLSHLLENGHALRNGGRTTGTHFISTAEQQIAQKYEEKIKEIIENGK